MKDDSEFIELLEESDDETIGELTKYIYELVQASRM